MRALLKKIVKPLLYPYLPKVESSTNKYISSTSDNSDRYQLETTFKGSSGIEVPVYKHYRYAVKPGWKYYGPLSALDDLNKKGLLEENDKEFLIRAVGHRTLTVPLEEAYDVVKKYQHKHVDLFLVEEIPPLAKRLLKPELNDIAEEIEFIKKGHSGRIKEVTDNKLTEYDSKPKILEIGYTSGGTSIIAFEKLGFDAHGIDYYFNESVKQTMRHEYIQELVGSSVSFHVGDITRETAFDDETFDIVYSASVIEHILDLDGAFKEIKRILKKGGLLISNYGSFLFPGGGHSLGDLDSPWAHVRLPKADYYDYLRKLRPYEADIAIDWIENALCPNYT